MFALVCVNCATPAEFHSKRTLESAPWSMTELRIASDARIRGPTEPVDPIRWDGSLRAYLAMALEHAPEARSAFHGWRARVLSIAKARRLPEPQLSYSYFIRSVETRTGPQRHRFELTQSLPWPTRLTAGADAAAKAATASQLHFDAQLLAVRYRVSRAYWRLWLLGREHKLKSEHDRVLEALARTARARVETGAADLAELSQIQLDIARHHDHHGYHREAILTAGAELSTAMGLPPSSSPMLANDDPQSGLPMPAEWQLRQTLATHPAISKHVALAESNIEKARAEAAEGLPSFQFGIALIETGEADALNTADSGQDPLIVSGGLALPLWRGSYLEAERAALAQAKSHKADHDAALRVAEARLARSLAELRDAERRVELFRATLIPQARTTYSSVLGSYRAGRSSVSDVLLAQRDLLELQIELSRAQAESCIAHAELELVVGRHVSRNNEVRPHSRRDKGYGP